MREDYTGPVGFATESAERRRNWIGRILTAALLIFIVWLAWTRVINAPDDPTFQRPTGQQSTLPGSPLG